MFRFEHPEAFYWLLLLLALVPAYFWVRSWQKRARERFGDRELMDRLQPDASRYKPALKFWVWMLAMVLLAGAWANPQWGLRKQQVTRQSLDVIVALDISRSMLAEDMAPNRLERTRRFGRQLLEQLRGDRVGLVYFAGSAYLQMPLSIDLRAADLFMKSADPSMASYQGTAMGAAINLAADSFDEAPGNYKAIVLISDGEEHEEDALSAAKAAAQKGIRIYTIGVGSPEGGFVPISNRGRADYLRDATGTPVRSVLNEALLKAIAKEGRGQYYHLNQGDAALRSLREGLNQMQSRSYGEELLTDYESYFQYLLAPAILLLLMELLLSTRRNPWLRGRDLFKG